jgi:hypothetical protein
VSTTYELRVEGHLDPHWAGVLGGLSLCHADDGTTTLTGPVADQAQLHGVLAGLRDMGATLLSVQAVPEGTRARVDVADLGGTVVEGGATSSAVAEPVRNREASPCRPGLACPQMAGTTPGPEGGEADE